jgi:hypothetical protein
MNNGCVQFGFFQHKTNPREEVPGCALAFILINSLGTSAWLTLDQVFD